MLRQHLGREIGGEFDPVAGLEPPRPLGEGTPAPAAEVAVERHLDRRRAAPAVQAGRDDAGVVEHHHVARPQQMRQVQDLPVGEPVADGEQPRRVARLARPAGDQLPRQCEIERVDPHGAL